MNSLMMAGLSLSGLFPSNFTQFLPDNCDMTDNMYLCPLPPDIVARCKATCCPSGKWTKRCTPRASCGAHQCVACPAGRWSDDADACRDCPAGRHQMQTGQSSCHACPAGTLAPAGSAACDASACVVPTFDDGNSGCQLCPAGKYGEALDGADCSACVAGCVGCPAGRFNQTVGATGAAVCTACASGHYAASSGTAECAACPKGRFALLPGSAACPECAQNLYNDERGADACKACASYSVLQGHDPPRSISTIRGATDPAANCTAPETPRSACPPGMTSSNSSLASCAGCMPGRFKPTADELPCGRCPCGRFSRAGAAACNAVCAVGSFGNSSSGTCDACPAAHFCVEARARPFAEAQRCPPGRYVSTALSASSDRGCSPCADGTFSNTSDAAACSACEGCADGVRRRCGVASEGYCEACAAGSWFDRSSAACRSCPAGFSCSDGRRSACGGAHFCCPPGSASPVPVAVGHFSTPLAAPESQRTGQARCEEGFHCERGLRKACPTGRVCRTTTTVRVAATAAAAAAGARDAVVNITSMERCRSGHFVHNRTVCVPCLAEGADCTDGKISLQAGFWFDRRWGDSLATFAYRHWRARAAGADSQFEGVPAMARAYRCAPGACGVEMLEDVAVRPQCSAGHTGPLCAVCLRGFYLSTASNSCATCPADNATLGMLQLLALLLFVACAAAAVRAMRRRVRGETMAEVLRGRLDRAAENLPQMLKLLVGMYQVFAAFGASFHAVQWPSQFTDVAQFFAVFNVDLFGSAVFKCTSAGDDAFKRFLWHTMSVLAVCLACAVLLWRARRHESAGAAAAAAAAPDAAAAGACRSGGGCRPSSTAVWNAFLPFLFLVYPSVSATVIMLLRCRDVDGRSYLLIDYSLRCDEAPYPSYERLAWVFVLLYPLGIMVFFLATLAAHRAHLPEWAVQDEDSESDDAPAKGRGRTAEEAAAAYSAYVRDHEARHAGRQEEGQQEQAQDQDQDQDQALPFSAWRTAVWLPYIARCRMAQQRVGFLSNAYKDRYWWFESVMTAYKLLMTTAVLFVADGTHGKILFSMFGSTALIALVAYCQPFRDADVLSLNSMVLLETLLVLFAAQYLLIFHSGGTGAAAEAEGGGGSSAAGSDTKTLVGLVLLVLSLFPIVATLWLTARAAGGRCCAAEDGVGSAAQKRRRSTLRVLELQVQRSGASMEPADDVPPSAPLYEQEYANDAAGDDLHAADDLPCSFASEQNAQEVRSDTLTSKPTAEQSSIANAAAGARILV